MERPQGCTPAFRPGLTREVPAVEEGIAEMSWQTIFRDAVPGVAGVAIYDKGERDTMGRYVVAKTMKLPTGKYRTAQTDYDQRPAALVYAAKWLTGRAEKAGTTYTQGDGATTAGYRPLVTA